MCQDELACIIKQEHTDTEYINILFNFCETYPTKIFLGFH